MGKNEKKRRGRKLPMLFLCLLVLLNLVIGTFTYFNDKGSAENYLPVGKLLVDLIDVFENGKLTLPGDTVSKDVSMKNNGTMDAVVRIKLSPSWDPASDSQSNPLLTDAVAITFGPDFAADWSLIGGWYYYNKVLAPGQTTSLLVDALKLQAVSNDLHAADYSGATYKLNILSESLQAASAAAEDTWNMTYTASGGTLTWSAL